MFQSHVFFKDCKDNRKHEKKTPNSTLLAEGKGHTATSLPGQRQLMTLFRLIHRVPSGEGHTATSLPCFHLRKKLKKIYRKNAPNRLSQFFTKKTKVTTMERKSYSAYSIGKGKEYSFEFKQDAVFAAQELGIKPTARKFKVATNTVKSWLKRFKVSLKTRSR